MKYKDYYAALGLERSATHAEIKTAYRKLARKYHPDVSKDPEGEAKFKEVAEAYHALKDPEKRAAYDELGRHPEGEQFSPSPGWERHFSARGGNGGHGFDDLDLSELFAGFASAGRGRADTPINGRDFEAGATISLEDAAHGTELELRLDIPDYDNTGRLRRSARTLKVRIPKGASEGQRLRLRGQGGHGVEGGRNGDLYLSVAFLPHPLFRVSGHDLDLDLSLAPWEAALGATIEIPTLEGAVQLKVPPATAVGRRMRLAGRGLPLPAGGAGDLFAVVRITMPATFSEPDRDAYRALAATSTFDPRPEFHKEVQHAG